MQLNPEEFTIGETTGEKLIAFLGVQSAPACLVNPPPPHSLLISLHRHTLQL